MVKVVSVTKKMKCNQKKKISKGMKNDIFWDVTLLHCVALKNQPF
jgi:hypothetical protein